MCARLSDWDLTGQNVYKVCWESELSVKTLFSVTFQLGSTWVMLLLSTWKSKPTLFAERGGRGTGERQTVPPKAERMVLLEEVAIEMLEVALNWWERQRETVSADRAGGNKKRELSWRKN